MTHRRKKSSQTRSDDHPCSLARFPIAGHPPVPWELLLLAVVTIASLAWWLVQPPIPQVIDYHAFADQRSLLGIPNVRDVTSNLAFLLVGAVGLRDCLRERGGSPSARAAWLVSFTGIALVSLGSAYYHWNPNSAALFWDRLPMTIAFMGLSVAIIGESVGERLVPALLPIAVVIGIASVVYWRWTDDLRLYYWVQTTPLLLIPMMQLLRRSRRRRQWLLLAALGCYVLAKVLEANDLPVFERTGGQISGHTLKHLTAAVGCGLIAAMLRSGGTDHDLEAFDFPTTPSA